MRELLRRLALSLAALLVMTTPALAADKTFGEMIKDSAISSAGSKGGEFAVKFVTGWIYNISCKPEQQRDEGSKALCSALGSVSGKSEEEWKAQLAQTLKDMTVKLDSLAASNSRIEAAIAKLDQRITDQFKQVPNAVEVGHILTSIDALYGRFDAEFRNPQQINKTDMDKFANDVLNNEQLHLKLAKLNRLLAYSVDNAKPTLTYPFFEFRQKYSLQQPLETFKGLETYDFAEKKFMYYRSEQQKAYLVYLWAAEIVEGECEINHDAKCSALPMTSTAFVREFDRYTREQLASFNGAVYSTVLSYSIPHSHRPNFYNPIESAQQMLLRSAYLTSTILGSGQGAWGTVLTTEGDPWDGRVTLECGDGRQTLSPAFTHLASVDDSRGSTIDWWVSRKHNGAYDEVRFSPNWRVNHYELASATPGPCRLDPALSNNDRLPWRSDKSEVTSVTKDGETYPVGFFNAIQRAGGSYAFVSGQEWSVPSQPEASDRGDATRKDTRFDWTIRPTSEGLRLALFNSGRGENTITKLSLNQEITIKNEILGSGKKSIRFPEGGSVKLTFIPSDDCEKVCRPGANVERGILDYDIENSPYEQGRLEAVVSIYLDPRTSGTDDQFKERARNGVFVDGSYGNTGDRKTMRVENEVSGIAKVDPAQEYFVQYMLYFYLWTHTKRLDPVDYRFMGKLTPGWLFLTK